MERIETEVKQELARFGPIGAIGAIVEAWPAAVGDGIAANAWPARIARDGTLHVAARSSTWAFELTHLASQILERLREALGDAAPSAMRFALGDVPERTELQPSEERVRLPRPAPEHEAQAAELVAGIDDEKLRESVQRAAALSLAKASVVGPF
jgi:hypothetical protein